MNWLKIWWQQLRCSHELKKVKVWYIPLGDLREPVKFDYRCNKCGAIKTYKVGSKKQRYIDWYINKNK